MVYLDYRYCHKFPKHIRNFSFSPVKGTIRIVFLSIIAISYISWYLFAQKYGLIVVLWSMLEGTNNPNASISIYTLKGFVVFFTSVYFQTMIKLCIIKNIIFSSFHNYNSIFLIFRIILIYFHRSFIYLIFSNNIFYWCKCLLWCPIHNIVIHYILTCKG